MSEVLDQFAVTTVRTNGDHVLTLRVVNDEFQFSSAEASDLAKWLDDAADFITTE